MKNFKALTLVGSAIATLGLAIAAPANAGQMHNGWNYSIDSYRDGSGGEKYNIRGLAIKETDDKIFVGFTGGTAREAGVTANPYDNIGWSDMFLNFNSNTTFTDLVEDYGDYDSTQTVYDVKDEYKDSLLAIKFAPHDQGGEMGLYSVDSLKGITKENRGYSNMNAYKGFLNKGDGRSMGEDLANKDAVYDYFGQNQRILNVVEEGQKLADISILDRTALVNEGLAFDHFDDTYNTRNNKSWDDQVEGDHTFGFSIDKSAFEGYLPGGVSEFMAHVFLECANDGVALAGNFTLPDEGNDTAAVPEPSALLGLSAMGLAFAARKRRHLELS